MKKTTLVLIAILLCSFAEARTTSLNLEFSGTQIPNQTTLFLKQELKRQYPQIDLSRAELFNVRLVAKSKHGQAVATLQIGDNTTDYTIAGSPYDFDIDNPRTWDRIDMVPRGNQQGVWQIHIRGIVKVKRVVLEIDTFERPEPPRPSFNIALNRFYNPRTGDHHITTMSSVGADYRFEATLGYISSTFSYGKSALFECLVRNGDHMLSLDPNCEGQRVISQLGFIDISNTPGKNAVYRCMSGPRDHFASLDRNCEGRTTEFRLGFI